MTSTTVAARDDGMATATSATDGPSPLKARSRSPADATTTPVARWLATEKQALLYIGHMQAAQPHSEANVGDEVSLIPRRRGEVAQMASRTLQQEGRQMYELPEQRICQTSDWAEERIASGVACRAGLARSSPRIIVRSSSTSRRDTRVCVEASARTARSMKCWRAGMRKTHALEQQLMHTVSR